MRSLRFMIFVALIAIIPCQVASLTERVVIDGEFNDWDHLTLLHTDPAGDQISGDIDFGGFWASFDRQYVFLSFRVGGKINLQSSNQITMYVDTDANSHTGTPMDGIGVDLEWTFGSRSGRVREGLLWRDIRHGDIGLISAPTVTAGRFEIAIDHRAGLMTYRGRFPSPEWRLVMVDESGGDRIPDAGQVIAIVFDGSPMKSVEPIDLAKHDEDHVRILSYNVERDGIFDSDPARRRAFHAILRAINPDIIGFQEIEYHSTLEIQAFVHNALAPAWPRGFGSWFSARGLGLNNDIVLVSRYPIQEVYPLGGNSAFLVDLSPWYKHNLLLIVAHPPCCTNDIGRQWEIDAMMAFVRDAKEPGGVLDLEPDTPIVLMGDMNLVGDSRQLETLLTGDIVNTDEYGPPFEPDWDGTDFADLMPRHTHLPMKFTWYNPDDYFWPGRLDYFIYSDAVVNVGNNFVLFTPSMPSRLLMPYGLRSDSATRASDHLPVVCDLILPVRMRLHDIP
ncbi:MAG: endonuclease/exonuclease/phosphatase family protein [Candidatus Eisenbacteria bacterium]